MKYITDIERLKLNNTVVTIGKFDGNHIGHKLLYDTVVSLKDYAMDAVILTFNPAIREITVQDKKQTILTSFEKQTYHYPEGIDYVIECEFTDAVRSLSPEKFVEEILVKKLGVRKIVVGNDFRFGKDRSGDIRTLYDLGCRNKFELFPMEKITYDGVEVSSTYIKEKLLAGDLTAANAMLGEPYFISGPVEKGKQLGRTIGFPTVNLLSDGKKLLPPDGGYATQTIVDGKHYNSITNIGFRPTVEDSDLRTIETYILDFHGDLYGKIIRIEFFQYLRPEQKFASLEELQEEIRKNVEEVRAYFDGQDRVTKD